MRCITFHSPLFRACKDIASELWRLDWQWDHRPGLRHLDGIARHVERGWKHKLEQTQQDKRTR